MANAVCEYVEGGGTFRTSMQDWIRLARYDAPEEGEPDYDDAKQLLSSLILDKEIVYEPVGTSHNQIIAEVWQGVRNINVIMIQSGYQK
jgi:endonuclease YncB( thermonuclease family)